jgi:hypothetical protein
MKKLKHGESDSLELLLDTVCSMFGAILLIAILVALMAKTTPVDPSSNQAADEIAARRIEIAKKDLEKARELESNMEVRGHSDVSNLIEQKNNLAQEVSSLRSTLERSGSVVQDKIAQLSLDPGGKVQALNETIRSQERLIEDYQNQLKTQNQNKARMRERITEIGSLIQRVREDREITLRFPKERTKTKLPLNIVCKFGKVYETSDFQGRQNNESIKWTKINSDEDTVEPISNLGWDPTTQMEVARQFVSRFPKESTYAVFLVFQDSFATFQAIKDLMVKSNIDYGVHLYQDSVVLTRSSDGTVPPPQ